MAKLLDHKLDCKKCGTIYLDIPDGATESTQIRCSTCGGFIGEWGELQDDFNRQAGDGVFDLKDGQIEKR
jgi:LSD1 subclass zinc finger protein